MSRVESPEFLEGVILNPPSSHRETSSFLVMAKPGIPVEKPRRRKVPDVTYPSPKRTLPPMPVRTPREPIPVRR